MRIRFGGAVLEGVVVGDKNFVAMKPIVEGLGLDWGKQLAVMKADPVLKDELCTLRGIVAEDGKRQEGRSAAGCRLSFSGAYSSPLRPSPP